MLALLALGGSACSLIVDSSGLTGGASTGDDDDSGNGADSSVQDATILSDANPLPTPDATSDGETAPNDAADSGEPADADAGDTSVPTDYASLVLAAGPLAYWRFDETSGVVANSQVNPAMYTGAYQGGVTLGVPSALGEPNTGAAVRFDGVTTSSSGALAIGNVFAFANDAPCTFEFWFRPIAIDTSYRQLFSHGINANMSYAFFVERSATSPNDLFFATTPNGTTSYVDSNSALTIGAWTYLVIAYDGTMFTMYKDTTVIATTLISLTAGAPDGGVAPFFIGSSSSGFNELYGDLDEFAVYGHALDRATINAHYAAAQIPLDAGVDSGVTDGGKDAGDSGSKDAGDAGDGATKGAGDASKDGP